jgi:hypothetical protein
LRDSKIDKLLFELNLRNKKSDEILFLSPKDMAPSEINSLGEITRIKPSQLVEKLNKA